MTAQAFSAWPGSLFDDPSETLNRVPTVMRDAKGEEFHIDSVRWHARPSRGEQDLLDRVVGPVLDVGCGPGRHVLALVQAGRIALGIDISPAAVATARRRGAPAVRVSVFGSVPGCGSWATALLLDGNIGIGGNPRLLLARVAELLEPDGHVLVEVESTVTQTKRLRVRVEHAGQRGRRFSWARVGLSHIDNIADSAGFMVSAVCQVERRWFVDLERVNVARTAAESRTIMGAKARPGPQLRLCPGTEVTGLSKSGAGVTRRVPILPDDSLR